ncbi:MAG: 30S ribosomal protein S6, partial [Spirochaetales bacterium]|nr:30S ribosomal protein S6 [Spirochaetales bacterium]
ELIAHVFTDNNLTVTKSDDLGVKYLSYPIKKNDKAHYFYYELQADPEVIVKLERSFKLMTPVLKFLFVNKEK